MVTFEEFREITRCQQIGSRLIAEVDGQRNVDVGTAHGSSFTANEVGERLVAEHVARKNGEIAEVVREMTEVADVQDETKTFTERAAELNKKKGKK